MKKKQLKNHRYKIAKNQKERQRKTLDETS
jgi:hypothetical protein